MWLCKIRWHEYMYAIRNDDVKILLKRLNLSKSEYGLWDSVDAIRICIYCSKAQEGRTGGLLEGLLWSKLKPRKNCRHWIDKTKCKLCNQKEDD